MQKSSKSLQVHINPTPTKQKLIFYYSRDLERSARRWTGVVLKIEIVLSSFRTTFFSSSSTVCSRTVTVRWSAELRFNKLWNNLPKLQKQSASLSFYCQTVWYYVPVLGHNVYITSQYWDIMFTLRPSTSLQMPKIELHLPGIKPGPPAWQVGTLPKELSTL